MLFSSLRRLLGCVGVNAYHAPATAAAFVFTTACKAIREHLAALGGENLQGLADEYSSLQDVDVLDTIDADANAAKNRYVNVLPYDHNRVKIGGDNDYINASLVQGDVDAGQPRWTYIAAQGPLASTTSDFWRMVFEKQIAVLVMLTRVVENNHVKCADYFPAAEGVVAKYGIYHVKTTKVEDMSTDITCRHMLLTNNKTQEEVAVVHYHYHLWPDHGVPLTTKPIRQLCRILWDNGGQEPRNIVHCSAGIGRTGTFVTIDIMLRRLWHLSKKSVGNGAEPVDEAMVREAVDLPAVVHCLRKQRRGMVQSSDQYHFCYQAVLEEVEDACLHL